MMQQQTDEAEKLAESILERANRESEESYHLVGLDILEGFYMKMFRGGEADDERAYIMAHLHHNYEAYGKVWLTMRGAGCKGLLAVANAISEELEPIAAKAICAAFTEVAERLRDAEERLISAGLRAAEKLDAKRDD
jgi:hypothetical protein